MRKVKNKGPMTAALTVALTAGTLFTAPAFGEKTPLSLEFAESQEVSYTQMDKQLKRHETQLMTYIEEISVLDADPNVSAETKKVYEEKLATLQKQLKELEYELSLLYKQGADQAEIQKRQEQVNNLNAYAQTLSQTLQEEKEGHNIGHE
ncbi:hypothetical protein JOC78_001743 [Bacillus ectoiniformans]|uniref:hypothetical protein n=1 Tax=Bacillus ectoiniformans TaxID=1494429 RepID=UPI001956D26D|nr:hypothetical protein [Bacillus ectoiniformans]MBM7648797.1 hypothetical protein [Bacillus ectoiniformans]